MATTNVGNLNVKLTLSADQFAAALQTAGGQVNVFARGVQMQAQQTEVAATGVNRFSGAMRTAAPILTSVAFGAQDFASQLGTRGLGAALSAASNNIQVMGAAFGPWGLAISSAVGLGVSAIGTYLDYQQRTANATKNTTKIIVDRWREASREISDVLLRLRADSAEFSAGLQFDAKNAFGGASAQELRGSLERLQREEAVALGKRDQLLKEFDRKFNREYGNLLGVPASQAFEVAGPGSTAEGASAVEGLNRLSQAGFTVTNEMVKAAKELDQSLLELDQELSQNSQEYRKRSDALKEADRADAAAAKAQEDLKTQTEKQAEDQQLQKDLQTQLETPFDRIRRAREQIEKGFGSGLISESERQTLLRQQDQAERDARRQALEDRRRGRATSATEVPANNDDIEKNTKKTATEVSQTNRRLDTLIRVTENAATGTVPV